MTIQVGDKVPDVNLAMMGTEKPRALSTRELFEGKKVVLFAVPGAFTPTCSEKHLPGFLQYADEIKAKGVDTIACIAVNDIFVIDAWAKAQNVGDKVLLLGDGDGEFTREMGLELDLRGRGYGVRSQRYAAIVENSIVKFLQVEQPGKLEATTAEKILENL